jgi:predicted DNA-binding protein (UPF0251 family)
MPRPRMKRTIGAPPVMEGFKPFGVPMNELEPVVLLFEEYESMRLADYDGLNHEQASERMNVSRATFTRIYEQARRSIAKAFIECKVIIIEGGDYQSDDFWYRCERCMKVTISPSFVNNCNYCHSENIRLLNRLEERRSMAPGGDCICVHCSTRIPHIQGQPCKEQICPQCGKKMMREGSYHHQLYLQKQNQGKEINPGTIT